MDSQLWSWVVTIVGLIGFYLAGKKIWWAWYINIVNQALWATFAVATQQWGFLLGVPLYLFVFGKNAWNWTKDRPGKVSEVSLPIGRITRTWEDESGFHAEGLLNQSDGKNKNK